ncbi:MAG TPA: elongation factor P, partial [Clostridiales bacterium]|nr:elongation factor P [Clostridiales bacterium]
MVSAGDFRNGVTFEMDGNVVQIIEFQHVKPGKGAAFVRTKIKNVISGSVVEKTFNPSDKYPTAYVERKDMQYLYSDDELYYFMDNESYEQIPINKSILSDSFAFVKENMEVKVL